MIRFVDLGTQLDAMDEKDGGVRAFAFYDTITSSFIKLNGDQTWESWEEFEESWNSHLYSDGCSVMAECWPLTRFKGLYAPWIEAQKEQVKQVRAVALEDAAKICEHMANEDTKEREKFVPYTLSWEHYTARILRGLDNAAQIRTLKRWL